MADPYAVYANAPEDDEWAEFEDEVKPGTGSATVNGVPVTAGQEKALAGMGGIRPDLEVGTPWNPRFETKESGPAEHGTYIDLAGRTVAPQDEPISKTLEAFAYRRFGVPRESRRLDAIQSGATSGLLMGGKNELLAGAGALGNKLRGGDFSDSFKEQLGLLDTEDANLRQDFPVSYYGAGAAGAGVGGLLAPEVKGAGVAGKVAMDAGIGGLGGFLSTDGDLQDRAIGAGAGAVLSGAGSGIARRAQKAPVKTPARVLTEEGIRLPPGMMLGGPARTAESLATSVPVLGGGIKKAERIAVEDLNRAATNRALAPVGKSVPKDVAPGHEMIEYADRALSDVYDSTLGPLKIAPDATFQKQYADLKTLADELPEDIGGPVIRSIDRRLGDLFQGPIDGPTFKKIDSDLARKSRQFNRSDDPFKQDAGDIYDELRVAMREALERANPQAAEKLRDANLGFANLVRVQRAARRSPDGVFTAAQLDNAVKALDNSARGKQASMGGALMQDLSGPAAEVMQAYPDSGTAGRIMGGAGLVGAATNPVAGAAALGGLGAGRLAYSTGAASGAARLGSNAMEKLRNAPRLSPAGRARLARILARQGGPAAGHLIGGQ